MWMPKTEDEIKAVVLSRRLEETNTFDAKQELAKTSEEIAKDIAAMAVDGGVIIYGIGEDEQKRPTRLTPVSLAGARERIDSVVGTAIDEPPFVKMYTIPTEDDPSVGYVIVVVPQSPRAPHMVTIRDINSYYGRSATGNRKLNQSEVRQLYDRNRAFEIDREALLNAEIAAAPIAVNPNSSYIHMYSRPVVPNDGMLKRLSQDTRLPQSLNSLFANLDSFYEVDRSPFIETPLSWVIRTEGFRGSVFPTNRNAITPQPETVTIQLDHNGMGHVFCARAAEREGGDDSLLIFYPTIVAGIASRFIGIMGRLYDQANYYGAVDIGVAVTNLTGAVPSLNENFHFHFSLMNNPYDRNEYRKIERRSAIELLENPQQIGSDLLMPLIQAINQNNSNPFPKVKPE